MRATGMKLIAEIEPPASGIRHPASGIRDTVALFARFGQFSTTANRRRAAHKSLELLKVDPDDRLGEAGLTAAP